MNKCVSVIIPNFNGRGLLKENLPILFSEMDRLKQLGGYEIIVVDDGSVDSSAQFVQENFPRCKLLALEKNYGFSYAVNAGALKAQGQILYLLNSDVKVCRGFLEPLLPYFEKSDVFAVSSLEAQDVSHMAIPLVKFKYGIFWYWYQEVARISQPLALFCVSGGHSAYDREKFLALGGFDTLFRPFYAEDGDICWRAWKRGWQSLLEPQSIVMHECKGTIGRFYSRSSIQNIHWKNRILMTWKNLTSRRLLARHLLFLFPEVVACPFIGKKELTMGFFMALKQLPELMKARKAGAVKNEAYHDEDLFRRFSRYAGAGNFRIIYLHEASEISGAENSLINLVRNIDREKFNPVFILPKEGPLSCELRKMGIDVRLMAFPPFRKGAGVMAALKRLRRLIKESNGSLIHSNSIRTHIYGVIAARLADIPSVWHERNLITSEWFDPDRLLSFLPDKIICNSFAIAERFTRRGLLPENVIVVHNGVDVERFHPNIPSAKIRSELGIGSRDIVIGIASRFHYDKGHETFFEAAKIIIGKMNDPDKAELRFLVVGGAVFSEDREREKYLRKMVERLGINDKVIFAGFREDMPQFYAAMDIMVLASDAEPCGRVILEAMASSKPIVATMTGGTPEIVVDKVTGLLVPARDPYAMAEALYYLVKNNEAARKMGNAARELSEKAFSIISNVHKTESVYLDLLSGKIKESNAVSKHCLLCGAFSQRIFLNTPEGNYLRCQSCGLVQLEKIPDTPEVEAIYNEPDYFHKKHIDGAGADFIGEENLYFQRFRDRLRKIEAMSPKGKILDIGASVGQFLLTAKANGWDIYGLEISREAALTAKEKYGIEIKRGRLKDTTFKNNYFDVITLWHTFEHFSDPLASLGVIAGLLKERGLLALEVPNINSKEALRAGKDWAYLKPREHLFHYAPATMRALLEKSGFVVDKIEYESAGTGLGMKLERFGMGSLRRLLAKSRVSVWGKKNILSWGLKSGSCEIMIVFARKK